MQERSVCSAIMLCCKSAVLMRNMSRPFDVNVGFHCTTVTVFKCLRAPQLSHHVSRLMLNIGMHVGRCL